MFYRLSQLLLFTLLICFSPVLKAQLTSDADRIAYNQNLADIELRKDPILVYYSKDNGFNRVGTITARITDSTNLNFKWYLYNELTHRFDSLIKTDNNVAQSKRGECTQGGYMIKISGNQSNWDTALYCWVFQKNFSITGIQVKSSLCDKMTLSTQLQFDETYSYFNRLTDQAIVFTDSKINKLKIVWEDTPNSGAWIGTVLEPTFSPPTKPTVYVLTITDTTSSVNISRSFRIDIDETSEDGFGNLYLKAVKAKFTASRNYIPDFKDESDSTGQAPLIVQFVDSSENADLYEWRFYKSTNIRSSFADSLLMGAVYSRLIPDSVIYTQLKDTSVGKFDVFLKVEGPYYYENNEKKRCVDTLRKKQYIKVTKTFMSEDVDIPNVFTPNGDGINDLFTFQEKYPPTSIRHFSVKIYNRWGNKIYEYEDNNGNWQGWNGETTLFGRAPAGVYFYSIIYEGWNGDQKKERRGMIHLFRGKKD